MRIHRIAAKCPMALLLAGPPRIHENRGGSLPKRLSGIRQAGGKKPLERKKVLALTELTQAREIDAVRVTEFTRRRRSTQNLVDPLGHLFSWDASLIVQT